MAKIMDPILSILSILGYWAIILGTLGGPGLGSRQTGQKLLEFVLSLRLAILQWQLKTIAQREVGLGSI